VTKRTHAAIRKVLIANRGEIAVRIIRTCRELGIKAVAVYSDVDRWALHSRLADEAHPIGPAPASASYLNAEKLIEIAKRTKCDALHPGYGFLAENASFSELIEKSDLTFIGPQPEAMRLMGDKLAARNTARKQGVPTVPGIYEKIATLQKAKKAAAEIGYPILIKAAAGGGGKGMRLVLNESELESSFERAMSEVQKSFGDPSVYVERFIPRAKHIEVQILGDGQGSVIHLYERECSVQRRYQKLLEETPAPRLSDEMRQEMCEAAVAIASAARYRSAGTVEFIYDVDENRYYFLEMNTRIQVEHPITEMTMGLDLIREQIRIASGQGLSLAQEDVHPRGAALECRISAEDPEHDFVPSTGLIEELILPSGPGVRVDSGTSRGDLVTPHYDPLLLKLIVWDRDRPSALQRMRSALQELLIVGVPTTVGFHIQALADERFVQGIYTTDFVKTLRGTEPSPEQMETLAVAAVLAHIDQEKSRKAAMADQEQVWKWSP
jgi:acetyl-CoA carboxylase biotin carboxylase subunit